MARRRMNYQMRQPKVRLPKKKTKIDGPKNSELNLIYKRTVTGSIASRIAALMEAVSWWDNAILSYISKSPMTGEQIQKYETANKVRTMGVNSTTPEHERTNALERVIKLYQKIWEDQNPPTIDACLKLYEDERVALMAKDKALNEKYEYVMTALNAVFSKFGIEIAVHQHDTPRMFDGGKILLSKSLVKVLAEKARKEGLLPVIFSEAPTMLKAYCVERDAEGGYYPNLQRYYDSVPMMLESVLSYFGTVDSRKVFRAAPTELEATIKTTVSTATPRVHVPREVKVRDSSTATPRTPRGPSKADLVLDMLKREGGASVDEILAATGWGRPESVRGFFSGTVRAKLGLKLIRPAGTKNYAIA